ncbi:MAG: hypothetical protein SFZ23_06690 [Planctomycetota bacterium]|nr:hypothetical protein [Planctomycetota bacterium]
MVRLRSYAKLNLILSVGPPEPPTAAFPGYHPIASWFHAINLFDEVEVEPSIDVASRPTNQTTPASPSAADSPLPSASLDISWASDAARPSPIDWPASKDLCVRAHAALQKHVARPLPCQIRVRKRIPVGGGMGGGSSNAAATLRALNLCFSLGLAGRTLREIGAALGSDVPFFLDDAAIDSPHDPRHDPANPPRPALVSSFGERIERITPVQSSLVLVVPSFGCETRAVYRALDALDRPAWSPEHELALVRMRHAATARTGVLDPGSLFNHLTRAAASIEPRIGSVLRAAADAASRPAHMSGSGSTIFIPCRTPTAAEDAAAKVRAAIASDHSACVVLVTQLTG